PIVAGKRLALAEAVRDGGDIAQQDATVRTGAAGCLLRDQDAANLAHALQLADRAQGVAVASAADRTARRARGRPLQRRPDLLQRDPVALHARAVDVDRALALQPAGHAGLRDAVDLLETPTEHGFGELLEVPEADVAGDADRHDRLAARIGAQHDRARRTLGQDVAQRIDLLAHVERGEIHVRAPREAQNHQ